MQAADLVKYMNNPRLLNEQNVEQLEKLVNTFPYFQSAHMLLSMASKKFAPAVYQQSLKKTAIVVGNRSHLFRLIHDLENELIVAPEVSSTPDKEPRKEKEIAAVKEVDQPLEQLEERKEETKQELDILKATEIVTEISVGTEEEKPKPLAEEVLAKEIGKEVVNAFVGKEILKIQDISKPETPVESPESFGDWLSFLKKNNGQSYEEIEEQVSSELAKKQVQKEERAEEEIKKTASRQSWFLALASWF